MVLDQHYPNSYGVSSSLLRNSLVRQRKRERRQEGLVLAFLTSLKVRCSLW
jgi:hypothetical protein